MRRAFETAECEAVRSSIFWELRYEKHENRMKGCDVEQKVRAWFRENGMALNLAKSDVILFGTSQRLKTMSGLTSVKIADSIQVSDSIKILGARTSIR